MTLTAGRRAAALATAAWLALAAAADVRAAEGEAAPAAAPAAEAPPAPFPLAEVTVRAEETRRELEEMTRRLAPDEQVGRVEERISAQEHLTQDAWRNTRDLLHSGTASLRSLADTENEWIGRQGELRRWHDQVTARAAAVDREVARLGELSARWKATDKLASAAEGAAFVERIDAIRASIRELRSPAKEREAALAALSERLSAAERIAADALDAVRQARVRGRRQLFEPEQPPLWAAPGPLSDGATLASRIAAEGSGEIEALRAFEQLGRSRLAAHALLLLAALVVFAALHRQARGWPREDEALRSASHMLRHPLSLTILFGVVVAEWLYPVAPRAFREALATIGLIPTVTLLPPLLGRRIRPLVYAVVVFFASSLLREFLAAAPELERWVFTAELIGASAFGAWLHHHVAAPGEDPPIGSGTRLAIRTSLAVLAVALVGDVFGFVALATVLARGVLVGVYAATILYAAYRVSRALVAVVLRASAARRLRIVRVGGPRIELWSGRMLRLAAALLWLVASLRAFTVEDTVETAIRTIVSTPFTLGKVSLSLSGVLIFVITVVSAFALSSLLRFVLEEDVFPRVVLRRGVSNAISTTLHYTILLLGFVFALAAAGVDLSKVTLLAGALGVGIGFGLQNVVNNFVSGLILLFERPIQVGDTIEVGGLRGEVRHIGPRSSTVRTYDGAEVIVPNAMLVSDQVVNWTLSDRRRRITVEVGVAYGNDPERVLQILRDVAEENKTVLDDPAPSAVFKGFGESSLDFALRCWIPRFEEGFLMQSELALAINRKLREAGIEIPFPQRDLHLRSVADPARGALAELARDEREPGEDGPPPG